jgi:hypothetical protein
MEESTVVEKEEGFPLVVHHGDKGILINQLHKLNSLL